MQTTHFHAKRSLLFMFMCLFSSLLQCFFILGEFVLVAIAVALPSWRAQFTAGALLCAASLLLWFVVPESGRWLQVQGRGEEAYQVRDIAM